MFQNWITKETISRLILPHSKMIEGAFAIEFYKMLNSNNWIGNIILEENISIRGINFSLMLNKYINKYNSQIFGYDIKTEVYFENKNNYYFESYIKNFNFLNNRFDEKYYCVKNDIMTNKPDYVREIIKKLNN